MHVWVLSLFLGLVHHETIRVLKMISGYLILCVSPESWPMHAKVPGSYESLEKLDVLNSAGHAEIWTQIQ